MEAISVAASAITLIDASAKTSKALQRLNNRDEGIRRIAVEVSLSLQKISVWQKNWSVQAHHFNVSAKAIWGIQGWATVQTLLENVVKISKNTEQLLQDELQLQESQKPQPRLRWIRSLGLTSKKQRPAGPQKLQDLASNRNQSVDELWIYSESVFDFIHGILANRSKSTERGTRV